MAAPELSVVCKSCRSEVSPYVTECPYCGTRLRKRAPKLERVGDEVRVQEGRRAKRRRRQYAKHTGRRRHTLPAAKTQPEQRNPNQVNDDQRKIRRMKTRWKQSSRHSSQCIAAANRHAANPASRC